ncbi:MAG: metallophosphoesterase family protein [Thermodesulfobacteriota bacterium]
MRYAVISDPHSNLEALTAVLSEIDAFGTDETLCLGDLVGYNADPNECVELIRARGIRCVMGNHDSRASGVEEPGGFNPIAAEALLWTREKLTEENRAFIEKLPRAIEIETGEEAGEGEKNGKKFLAVHGRVNDTDGYILGPRDAVDNFRLLEETGGPGLCFFGHTHVRVAYVETGGRVTVRMDETLEMNVGSNYLVNPGSVGQPRDGDPRAAFLTFDSERMEIESHRVAYDIELTARKIMDSGLPSMLAERLKAGW